MKEIKVKQEQCMEKSSIFYCKKDKSNAQRLKALPYTIKKMKTMCKKRKFYPMLRKRYKQCKESKSFILYCGKS